MVVNKFCPVCGEYTNHGEKGVMGLKCFKCQTIHRPKRKPIYSRYKIWKTIN